VNFAVKTKSIKKQRSAKLIKRIKSKDLKPTIDEYSGKNKLCELCVNLCELCGKNISITKQF
jgi:hypothetical protein